MQEQNPSSHPQPPFKIVIGPGSYREKIREKLYDIENKMRRLVSDYGKSFTKHELEKTTCILAMEQFPLTSFSPAEIRSLNLRLQENFEKLIKKKNKIKEKLQKLLQKIKDYQQKLVESKSWKITSVITFEKRQEGPYKPTQEIIFCHEGQWFVLTREELTRMVTPTDVTIYIVGAMSGSRLHLDKPSVRNHDSEMVPSSEKLKFKFEIKLRICSQIYVIDSNHIMNYGGVKAINMLLTLFLKKTVQVLDERDGTEKKSFLYQDETERLYLLYDGSQGAFHCDSMRVEVCTICFQEKMPSEMTSHLLDHHNALKRAKEKEEKEEQEFVKREKDGAIECPNCKTYLQWTNACHHLKCSMCYVALCFRCGGMRSYPGESTLPDKSVFFVENKRLCAPSFNNYDNKQITKKVLICPHNCYAKHNMGSTHCCLKEVDGVLKHVPCCGGIDIMVDGHKSDDKSSLHELQAILTPEQIEEARQLQERHDRQLHIRRLHNFFNP
jgi:hypothetical protein